MTQATEDYERVSIYNLDDPDREELLQHHAERTFNWNPADMRPKA